MSNDDRTGEKRETIALAIATGTVITTLGLGMLVAAADLGASKADFCLELGVAVALSGILWKCALQIRRETMEGKTDWSAVIALLVTGGGGVTYALINGKQPQDALLTLGAAFVTVWLFNLLERQFVLDKYDLPVWAMVLLAPIYPFFWQSFRNFGPIFPVERVTLDVKKLLDELELEAQLDVWDTDSPYRNPEYMRAAFDTKPSDVSDKLGRELPKELVEWVNDHSDITLATLGGDTVAVWNWPAVYLHPVNLPDDVIIFGEEIRKDSGTTYVLGVDMRPGPLFGSVVRGALLPGHRSKWPVTQPLEVIATSFKQWIDTRGTVSTVGKPQGENRSK